MQVLAVVVGAAAVQSVQVTNIEFYQTNNIDIDQHATICQAILDYCVFRTNQKAGVFSINAIKCMDAKFPNKVWFGASVAADEQVISEHETKLLKDEIKILVQTIRSGDRQLQLVDENDHTDPETLEVVFQAQEATIETLRRNHGGERLKRDLEIRTDNEVIVKLENRILSKPDAPAEEQPGQISGQVWEVGFDPMYCKINPGTAATTIKALVSNEDLFDRILRAGRARRAVNCELRFVKNERGVAKAELVSFTELISTEKLT